MTVKKWNGWHNLEVYRLRSMYNQGAPIKVIADQLGRSLGSVREKIKHLGLANRRPRWSKEDVNILKNAYREGVSSRVVAKKLGRSIGAVHSMAYNIGITNRANIDVETLSPVGDIKKKWHEAYVTELERLAIEDAKRRAKEDMEDFLSSVQ